MFDFCLKQSEPRKGERPKTPKFSKKTKNEIQNYDSESKNSKQKFATILGKVSKCSNLPPGSILDIERKSRGKRYESYRMTRANVKNFII